MTTSRAKDPLAGKSGMLGEQLRSLTGDELSEFIRYWEGRHEEMVDRYSGWWATKLISAGRTEHARRRKDEARGPS